MDRYRPPSIVGLRMICATTVTVIIHVPGIFCFDYGLLKENN